jgi:carbonic anhydrase/acetyltransferase-like protein (isoleucine patch superfamily)
MKQLENLIDEIVHRVNTNLREFRIDVGPYAHKAVPIKQFLKFYAFYGLTDYHPIDFHFGHSSLAGSYFLGKCHIDDSVLYKTDVRGDELKRAGATFKSGEVSLKLRRNERIVVRNAYLIKTLVHCYSHDPEFAEEFPIENTISAPYANIHGAPMRGCFLGPFATVDLTTVHDCEIGAFSYLQMGELSHTQVEPGTIWLNNGYTFHFLYQFPGEALREYIHFDLDRGVTGILFDFVESHKPHFQKVFDVVHLERPDRVHRSAALNRYAVLRGRCNIAENVLVAQRAYLENADMGKGANAQENCYIVNARLEGYNVTAHGAKIIHAVLKNKVFVGFNAFVRSTGASPLTIGAETIIMPHTIIDVDEPLDIPPDHLVWGLIRKASDLQENSLPLDRLSEIKSSFRQGRLHFQGSGKAFVAAFRHRIESILETNGAYFDGRLVKGHAQSDQNIAFNIIQPFTTGTRKGLYPTIDIHEKVR